MKTIIGFILMFFILSALSPKANAGSLKAYEKSVSKPKETRTQPDYGEQPSDNCGVLCTILEILFTSDESDYEAREPSYARIDHNLDGYTDSELSEASRQAAPIISPGHYRETQSNRIKELESQSTKQSEFQFDLAYNFGSENINGYSGGMEFNVGSFYGLFSAESLFQDEFNLARRTIGAGVHFDLGYTGHLDLYLAYERLAGDDTNDGFKSGLVWTIIPSSNLKIPISIAQTYYLNNEVTEVELRMQYYWEKNLFFNGGVTFRSTEVDTSTLAIVKLGIGVTL